jgi:hypothetical protein
MEDFVGLFSTARAEGLGVTLHIAEVTLILCLSVPQRHHHIGFRQGIILRRRQ